MKKGNFGGRGFRLRAHNWADASSNRFVPASFPKGTDFRGRVTEQHRFDSLTLAHVAYRSDELIPYHHHAKAYCSLLLQGAYREGTHSRKLDGIVYAAIFHSANISLQDQIGPSGAKFFMVELEPAFLNLLVPRRTTTPDFCFLAPTAVKRLVRLYAGLSSQELVPFEAEAAMAEVVATLVVGTGTREKGEPKWLRDCLDLIEAQGGDLRLKQLARLVNVHPVHIARTFKERLGYGIVEHCISVRLRRAAQAITSGVPLADAALVAGFADQSHMTRTMKTYWRMTPNMLRVVQGRRHQPESHIRQRARESIPRG